MTYSSTWKTSAADLEEGTEIEFDIEQVPKGPRATNVVRN